MITFYGGLSRFSHLIRWPFGQVALLALAIAPSSLSAQSSEDLFRGTWQIQTPEEGALVIILKSQGIASYFWGDNADRSVYKGTWEHADSTATATWADGSSHLIERTGSGFTATYRAASGNSVYNSPAQQLPQEMLGQWAKPPTREDEMRSDRDKAKGYFGIWSLGESGEVLFVEPDRSAATNIGPDGGQRGEWAKQGSELHIIWDSGEYSILSETERDFKYKQIPAGEVIEEDTTESVSAKRTIESTVPAAWLANYKSEREGDTEGIAFSSRKVARIFYRGDWLVRRGENAYEQIELARFGGLKTTLDRSLDGQWTLSGQDVFMRWDNGMRKILSPVGRGFVLYEYRPGRPLDGVPTRVLAAAPADTAKLAEHLKGREDVAEQMRQMAEAAGIDPATQEDAGWGRNFARWAWPFGDDTEDLSAEEMLADEFDPKDEGDPWWWPFWSETPVKEEEGAAEGVSDDSAAENLPGDSKEAATEETPESDPLPVEMVEVDQTEAEEAATETPAEETPAESSIPKTRTKKDWLWPF